MYYIVDKAVKQNLNCPIAVWLSWRRRSDSGTSKSDLSVTSCDPSSCSRSAKCNPDSSDTGGAAYNPTYSWSWPGEEFWGLRFFCRGDLSLWSFFFRFFFVCFIIMNLCFVVIFFFCL